MVHVAIITEWYAWDCPECGGDGISGDEPCDHCAGGGILALPEITAAIVRTFGAWEVAPVPHLRWAAGRDVQRENL